MRNVFTSHQETLGGWRSISNAKYFGQAALDPIEYQDIEWIKEPWSNGCYGAYAPPGTYSRYGQWLRKPIGPLHWAGTETSARWTGYVDGAIRSGERAAIEVLGGDAQ